MKEIKTRETNNAPRILSDSARAPRELAKRSILEAKEKAKSVAQGESSQYSETPEQYASDKVEQTAETAAYRTAESGKDLARRSVREIRERVNGRKEAVPTSEHTGQDVSSTNGQSLRPSPQGQAAQNAVSDKQANTVRSAKTDKVSGYRQEDIQTNAYRAGRKRVVRQSRQRTLRNARHSAERINKSVKTADNTAKATIKASKKTVKVAEKTVKTVDKTAKTTVKVTQKAAQAAAKAAQTAAKAAQAAKAAAAAAKVAAKAIVAAVKAIISAVKALVTAIAAGGWVAVIVIVVIVLIIALLSVFGVFASNDVPDGSKPLTAAIEEIDAEFQTGIQENIDSIKESYEADVVELIFEGDMESLQSQVPNWADVVGVYAAKEGMDEDNPSDVTVVTPENIERLKAIFYDMNTVSYRTETETESSYVTDEYGAVLYDRNGDAITKETVTLYIYIDTSFMGYREGADFYNLNAEQDEILTELMRPEYYPLFAELLGDTVGDGGEYGFGLDINPDLPDSELGAQIVAAAKRYIGRSYSSMDCSKLCRTAYADCGLTSMNGKSSVYMAKACEEMGVLFTDPSQLQAGDLIFFSRFDPSRGPEYCGDTGRCGTGKCRRWMHIHHVAIYINHQYLIDSTGGNNSVQIRKHWGMDTAKWKWCCFGRPTR